MHVRQFLVVSAVLFGCAAVVRASEEEFLPWSEVRIVGPERKDTGKVVFSAKTAGAKYQEIAVEAFGKKHEVTKEVLEKLRGFPLNSLVITHEAGYAELGGHTVHFKMKVVQYDQQARLVEDRVVLSVSRGKGLAVSAPPRQVLKEAK